MLVRRLIVGAALAAALAACSLPTANTGKVSEGTGQTVSSAPPAAVADAPTWGKRYTWKDGLAVEVSAPADCKPGQYASPEGIKRAVKFKVNVINGTDKPFDVAQLSFGIDAQHASTRAEAVFDSNGACGGGGSMQSATILPGKSYSFEQAYSVGPAKGEMQLTFQPSFGADKAVYLGQA